MDLPSKPGSYLGCGCSPACVKASRGVIWKTELKQEGSYVNSAVFIAVFWSYVKNGEIIKIREGTGSIRSPEVFTVKG